MTRRLRYQVAVSLDTGRRDNAVGPDRSQDASRQWDRRAVVLRNRRSRLTSAHYVHQAASVFWGPVPCYSGSAGNAPRLVRDRSRELIRVAVALRCGLGDR